jgi:hypothetical protein
VSSEMRSRFSPSAGSSTIGPGLKPIRPLVRARALYPADGHTSRALISSRT